MVIGGTLGILFVTLLRRVMVEDPELPFPESVAASEIHKAGQQGSKAAKILFANMGFGALVNLLAQINVFQYQNAFTNINIGALGKKLLLRTSTNPNVATTITGGATILPARHQPRVPRRRLHHRTAPGGSKLCWRRARLGTTGSPSHLHHRAVRSSGQPAGTAGLVDAVSQTPFISRSSGPSP